MENEKWEMYKANQGYYFQQYEKGEVVIIAEEEKFLFTNIIYYAYNNSTGI